MENAIPLLLCLITGPEVAKYLALHLGEFLEKNEVYSSCRKNKDVDVSKIGKALVETFMAIDAHLLTEECMEELTEVGGKATAGIVLLNNLAGLQLLSFDCC